MCKVWPHRLSVRTPGFHPGKRGSTPLGATVKLKRLRFIRGLLVLYYPRGGEGRESDASERSILCVAPRLFVGAKRTPLGATDKIHEIEALVSLFFVIYYYRQNSKIMLL